VDLGEKYFKMDLVPAAAALAAFDGVLFFGVVRTVEGCRAILLKMILLCECVEYDSSKFGVGHQANEFVLSLYCSNA
jgi:hypothetical protein